MLTIVRKRILSILLFMLVLMIWSTIPSLAGGSNINEAEVISVNTPITDNLSTRTEDNYYMFSIPNDGVIRISFARPMQNNKYDYWRVIIYDENKNELAYKAMSGNYRDEYVPDTGLKAGSYYILVDCGSYYSEDNYTLTVNYLKSDQWEKESNNNAPYASEISVNKTYNGSLYKSADKDYYCFSIDQPGVINIGFTNPKQERTYDYWQIQLYDYNLKKITLKNVGGGHELTNFPQIGLPAGSYYVSVYRSSYTSCDTYGLTVNYQQSDTWESELNESAAAATVIKTDCTYYGSLCESSDDDYYEITIPDSGKYCVFFDSKKQTSNYSYWIVTVFDENVNKIDAYAVNGNTEKNSVTLNLSAGRYYIFVNRGSYYSGDTYKLLVSKKPVAPNSAKAKSGKKKVTIRWAAVAGANQYKVYKSTKKNSSYKPIKTVDASTLIIIDKGLKKGKTYYYKIKASKKSGDHWIYSNFSKVIKAKAK